MIFNSSNPSQIRTLSLLVLKILCRFPSSTPEEGQKTYRLKRCGNNDKNEDNSPKTLNDKNHQAWSQKFRQLLSIKDMDYEKDQNERCNDNNKNYKINLTKTKLS